MKREEIHWGDWHRILFGSAPAEFLIEVVFRTIITYLILMVILRLMGKRMGGQLTITELSVMLTLGAIVSVPMQAADRGILQGALVLICVLVYQRSITYFSVKYKAVEHFMQGEESIVIKNGVVQVDELNYLNISRDQLFAYLRSKNVYNLGEIRRVYMEACGLFSIFKYPEPRPGLFILPPEDKGSRNAFTFDDNAIICKVCGKASPTNNEESSEKCSNCGSTTWTAGVITNDAVLN
jgi:uncharacterized membrane protein YcaP (DUF421 family)